MEAPEQRREFEPNSKSLCRGYVPAKWTHSTECLRPSRDGHTDEIGLRDHHRSELPAAMRIGSTSRSESGSRTNPWAA
ncbi:hypothetical protein SAMN05444581_11589 [Methylocapsa palsarum]|uniref:Uncharacterized protein n=1 Tax=Methylocapsa palsarum TaxID=1612308 RepID=A0A1I4BN48_9HYPH|nr:hypothetical protein SAMN05444581_11589 [Methylocapsa palsarum]